VWYRSGMLDTQRRMHVYTPPGYDGSADKYPVFYLLHGGGDEDSGWSTIGRAGFILDNLIAAGKARPMLVVMPNGSLPRPTNMPRPTPGQPPSPEAAAAMAALQDRFTNELMKEVVPTVEKNFRVQSGRENRALAGLSMGGGQTLRVVTTNPDQFAYVAVWSAGIGNNPGQWEERNAEFLKKAEQLNRDVKLFSISVGDKDFTFAGSKALSEVLNKHGIKNELHVSGGGHTWINWRHYLRDLAPRLFEGPEAQAAGARVERSAPAPEPAPGKSGGLSGQWQSEFDTQIGPQKYAFDFKSDGGKLTGTAVGQVGDDPKRDPVQIRDGKVEGDKVSFVEVFPFNGTDLTITYSGTVKGDEMQLTRQVGEFATEQIVVKRAAGGDGAKP
jgi:enterochelin esterase-like enzyme